MRDQAAELRNLVLRASRETRTSTGVLPRIQWIIGARPEMGSTSLAVSVAKLLAESGYRIVLINGADRYESLHRWTGVTVGDQAWIAERREIHEVMQAGFAGLQVVGSLGHQAIELEAERERAWFHRQLCTLQPYADLVLIEAGPICPNICELIQGWDADATVVTDVRDDSILSAYASIRELAARAGVKSPGVLMNRAPSVPDAVKAWSRLSRSCHQFLQCSPEWIGTLCDSPTVHRWIESIAPGESSEGDADIENLRSIASRFLAPMAGGEQANSAA